MSLVMKSYNPNVPFAPPGQMASVVSFLVSDEAVFVNGEQIVVDGWFTSIV